MSRDKLKQKVAQAAIQYVQEEMVLGVGSGSTVNAFIEELAAVKHLLEACVAASTATEAKLRALGIPVIDLNTAGTIALYIDGADEVNNVREAIKGGGAALAREKVLASASKEWICLVDESKVVKRLGVFPVPVEVLPMARSFVARELVKLGGAPVYREGVVTDNHNCILDVYHLDLLEPIELESAINMIPGVVANGIFARRPADRVLVGGQHGVHEF